MLTLDTPRTYAEIARRVLAFDDDGQAIQHFMSDSPWSSQAVFDQIQTDVAALQDAGGWASPAMPLRYAESSAIANERVYLG